jgi:hypothetical protein
MSAIEHAEDEVIELIVMIILLIIVGAALWAYFELKGFQFPNLSALWQKIQDLIRNLLSAANSGAAGLTYQGSGSSGGNGPQIRTGITSSQAAALQAMEQGDDDYIDSGANDTNTENAQ